MKLKRNQIAPFELGLHHGAVAYALEFDNTHNSFYKEFESAAYKAGYSAGDTARYSAMWRSKGSIRSLLDHMVTSNEITPIGFKLVKYPFQGGHIHIEDLNQE